ncbi:MAG: signal peptide peptidase SppA [Planctomycetes bacterium]|nr:signal peptide peptidase SppA [Planctomycetota bacterium]
MSSLPPNPPPGVPPQAPQWPASWPGPAPAPREGKGVAFFVAIFLGILLIASAGLNVLLLLLSVGSLGAGLGGDADGGAYDEVHVAGERGSRDKVLQIAVRGAIAESGSPVLGAAGGSVSQLVRGLRRAATDDTVVGVLLYVDSPGGGVTDSDEMYQAIRRFRREHPGKPVMTLFGDIAASGGYYIAAATEHIVARRSTITGSIGVIMSAWNFSEAAKRFGVEQVAIKSDRTPYKDMLSPTRPMQPAEQAMLTSIVDELFDQFVDIVDEGRPGLDRDGVLKAATGAVYTGAQAKALGLVDDIGDHELAVTWFRQKLSKSVDIVEARRRAGFGDLLFGGSTAARPAAANLTDLLTSSTGPRFLYWWQGGR